MNEIKKLLFCLTPTTLVAIVAELDGVQSMYRQRQAAIESGYENCGEEFYAMLDAERDSRIRARSESKYCDEVAVILARQG